VLVIMLVMAYTHDEAKAVGKQIVVSDFLAHSPAPWNNRRLGAWFQAFLRILGKGGVPHDSA
jgi:hypothetical protein